MILDRDEDILNIFEMKCAMLCEGLYISPTLFTALSPTDQEQYQGRKGGAGPAGGRYFRFSNGSIANVPIWTTERSNPSLKIVDIQDYHRFFIQDTRKPTLHPIEVNLIPIPQFSTETTVHGISYEKIALMHGDRTLATTINQRCKYWRDGKRCQYCGIELSLNLQKTLEIKSGEQLVNAIHKAREEDPLFAQHLTLTIGTQITAGKGMEEYISIVKIIRKSYPNIPIHIQIEPMDDKSWYQKAFNAGVNTIGIHLEILNEEIRNEVCPGKKNISKETYIEHWKEAVKVFGKGQVSTFILTGFEKNYDNYTTDLELMIQLGVVPLITPTRFVPNLFETPPSTDINWYQKTNRFAAEKCLEYGLNPLENKAGCIRCGGCSPLLEIYTYLRKKSEEQK